MSNIILFDGLEWSSLLPLTYTRPVGTLRIGILTIEEKWQRYSNSPIGFLTQAYLKEKSSNLPSSGTSSLYVKAAILPSAELCEIILSLAKGVCLYHNSDLIAAHIDNPNEINSHQELLEIVSDYKKKTIDSVICIKFPEDIFGVNGEQIKSDFDLLTKGRKSQTLDASVSAIGDVDQIFLEDGSQVVHSIMNTTYGPIYIGKNAEIMEGSLLRGPLCIGADSTIKMGAKLYSNTTIGPCCKIGGEVKRAVFQGYSNKGHEGFVGDSVIGHWCNLGAGTNTSNMKNTYGMINLWDIANQEKRDTNQQFCGLIMGDHSKCGINTQFSTGTVVGVFANIFTQDLSTYISSFSWAASQKYDLDKAIKVARRVIERRGMKLTNHDIEILQYLYTLQQ